MTTITKIFLPVLILIFSGCASKSQLAKIEEHEWAELKCSGLLTWAQCRDEAHAMCPNGFYITDQFENITIQRREVNIACKS